ncbi:hypothetical protein C8R45DRAFT_1112500 [Mycena sanguinolenta]|nr:hypothetical protein C8R45DRAFT_1112500 [Mycena sanguinolenta]
MNHIRPSPYAQILTPFYRPFALSLGAAARSMLAPALAASRPSSSHLIHPLATRPTRSTSAQFPLVSLGLNPMHLRSRFVPAPHTARTSRILHPLAPTLAYLFPTSLVYLLIKNIRGFILSIAYITHPPPAFVLQLFEKGGVQIEE